MLSGCATTPFNKDQSAFEYFKHTAVGIDEVRLSHPRLHFTGTDAQAAWLEQIDSSEPGDVIEIGQFYVRPGRVVTAIRDHLQAKLNQGVRVRLKLDFMFSVSALREFDRLKTSPNFELEIVNPPTQEFIAFVAASYGVKDAALLVDAIISADLPILHQALAGSKLQAAIGQMPAPTPEVLLGAVLKRVVEETGFFKLLTLKSKLEELASRFHDKYLVVHRKHQSTTSVAIGGRGWADSFNEKYRHPNSLYYSDTDLSFEVAPETGGTDQTRALTSFAKGNRVNSARAYEANMIAAIFAARREIKIYTPYFTPTDVVLRTLAKSTQRGVQVSVYTNSVGSSDIPLVPIYLYANLAQWAKELGASFHFFTFTAPPGECLHTKVTLLDGEVAIVGSGNWDYRSFLYDSDSWVAVESGKIVQALTSRLNDPKFNAWHEWTQEELNSASEQLKTLVPEKPLKDALKFLEKTAVTNQL